MPADSAFDQMLGSSRYDGRKAEVFNEKTEKIISPAAQEFQKCSRVSQTRIPFN